MEEHTHISTGKKWLMFLMVYGVILIILIVLGFSAWTFLMDNIVFQAWLFLSQFIIVLIAQKAYVELKAEQN